MVSASERTVFISHAAYDGQTAKVLKDVLGRAGVGRTFLDADDIHPGDEWLSQIRGALTRCDAVVTLLTPQFAKRLWMSAEWAAFWSVGKPCYTLRLDVETSDVFDPMKSSQIADLGDVVSMRNFLDVVAEDNLDNQVLAERLVDRVGRARSEQRENNVEALFNRVLKTQNAVHPEVITDLIEAGASHRLAEIYHHVGEPGTNLTRLRLFAIAKLLLETGLPLATLIPLTSALENSNYKRDMVLLALAGNEPIDSRLTFADSQFAGLSTVGRQKVVLGAEKLGIALSEQWRGVPAWGE